MTVRGEDPGVITAARPGLAGGKPGGSAALLRSPQLAGVWAGQDFSLFQSVLSTSRGIFSFDSALPGHRDIPKVQHACAFRQAAAVCGFLLDWDELPDDLPPCENPRQLTAHSFTW